MNAYVTLICLFLLLDCYLALFSILSMSYQYVFAIIYDNILPSVTTIKVEFDGEVENIPNKISKILLVAFDV